SRPGSDSDVQGAGRRLANPLRPGRRAGCWAECKWPASAAGRGIAAAAATAEATARQGRCQACPAKITRRSAPGARAPLTAELFGLRRKTPLWLQSKAATSAALQKYAKEPHVRNYTLPAAWLITPAYAIVLSGFLVASEPAKPTARGCCADHYGRPLGCFCC